MYLTEKYGKIFKHMKKILHDVTVAKSKKLSVEALLHVMRNITAMCDVTNSRHGHRAGELIREGRQRWEDAPGDEELSITWRHLRASMGKSWPTGSGISLEAK